MRRKEEYPLEKVTLNLRDGDFERLQILHGKNGAGKIIRSLVIRHLKRVDERVSRVVPIPEEAPTEQT